jgi:L-ascorbate metabolism protein UlaG (beta-lactamase superfamily)
MKIKPSFFDPREDTAVIWLGMAGVLINARGTIVLIDPLITSETRDGQMFSEAGYRMRSPLPIEAHEIPRAGDVLYTHADEDHFGQASAQTLARLGCRFLAPPPVVEGLRGLGVDETQIVITREGQALAAGDAQITVTPALHDWQEQNPWRREDCCGYLIKTPDGVIWHPGDTRLLPELLEVRGVDVLFFDVAAVESHLGPEGSARLAKTSGARALVAYHYADFDLPPGSFATCDPQDALPYLEGVPGQYLQPKPGEPLILTRGKIER